jgi:2-oxo-3-hexenedioate decarboxylase
MIDADLFARVLDEALVGKREIQPLTKTYGEFDLATAYDVQARGIELRKRRGEKIVGYKMGLTSEAKRRQMSLGAPIYGVLTDAMRVDDEVRAADGVHPKIEPEIAFVTARDLQGAITREQAFQALRSVAPALEILDSRFAGFKYFSLTDVVADNCSSWKFALGPLRKPQRVDGLRMTMSVDGVKVQETDSNAISGHPLDSLVQLVSLLPHPLPAGSIVLAGAATVAEPLRPGIEISLDVETLGSMKVRG